MPLWEIAGIGAGWAEEAARLLFGRAAGLSRVLC